MSDVVRVFVGCAAGGEDAESLAVLEYTLRKHSSRPVYITWMKQSRDTASTWGGWETERWATPFSGFRWAIPAAAGYQGRAIYCDSDVWFQADPVDLLDQPFPAGAVVLAKPNSWRLCVCLWDCAAAEQHIPPLAALKADPKQHHAMTALFRGPTPLVGAFAGNWNCLDGETYPSLDDPDIKAIHYTDMGTQPHLRHALPRLQAAGRQHWFDGAVRQHRRPDVVARFDTLLKEAKDAGFHPHHYVPAEPWGDYRKASLVNYRGAPA